VFEAVLTSGHPPVKRWEGEAIMLPSGETRQVVATSVLLPEPDLVMATVQDVTERQQAEAERQHLQTQLIQAQKMEAVGQLAGGVAHDFNNILTAVLMQLSLLREEPHLTSEVQAGLKDLEGEAKRAANLTRQLLMFSRRQTLQPQLLDLNSLLGNLLKMLRRLIGEHISLEFSGAAGDLWLEADPGMLEQVVMNLVVNARDAMPAGGRVSLTTQLVNFDESASQRNPEARPGAFACLAITDTGCGMDEATIKHIFEPFFTTKEVGKGTGLGLATVYGIVKQHRGWVEVRSAVDHGSTFEVFLPASAQFTIKAVDEATVATLPRGDETLLVVEDEASVRRTMVTTLQRLGYRVLDAGNGPAALQIWTRQRDAIHLLITDAVMPGGLSGLDLADRVLEEKPDLHIILISGYSLEMAKRGLPKSKSIRFLQKPFEAGALARLVRECLDSR
jgi:signal transduction histidine kinase/ActR/RegA family two-component response regulator